MFALTFRIIQLIINASTGISPLPDTGLLSRVIPFWETPFILHLLATIISLKFISKIK